MRLGLHAATLAVIASLAACSRPPEQSAAPTEQTATPEARPPVIGPVAASEQVKPFTIGLFQAASVGDGSLSVPNDNKTLAINAKKADVDALLVANRLPTDTLQLSVQPLLVRTTERVLLFDTGAAALFGPTLGKLAANLVAAGTEPGSVTDIFISHAHGDHVGGLVLNDALSFPNATIHIQAAEWAWLKNQERMATLTSVIAPKVAEFQPGADLIPGVKAVDIKGHTPGHSGYLISSGDQSLLYIGDTMHHFVISVQQPEWTIAYDSDAPTAQASRKEVIANAVANGQRIYAVHFPFPGLGRFVKQDDKYVWAPEQL